MTSSSSPGISLMQEGMSYLAGAELPAVVINVMRGGPGLGNISPAQGDYFQATRGGGHGDYKTIVFGPSSVQEMADCTALAFDLADQYRMTVEILADGLLGQMMEPLTLAYKPRGKLPPKDWALTGHKGGQQNIVRSLWLGDGVLERHNEKLQAKYRQVQEKEVLHEEYRLDGAEIIVVAYGIVARIARALTCPRGRHPHRLNPADHLVALPLATDQPGRRRIPCLLDRGDEFRSDARGREAGRGRQSARALLRANGWRRPERR
jgi:2-oxoglutarate ferredoxin oxidoreductase subunit alpha